MVAQSPRTGTFPRPGRRPLSWRPIVEYLEDAQLLSRSSEIHDELLLVLAAKKVPKPLVLHVNIKMPPGADSTTIVGGKLTAKAKVKLDLGADGSIEQVVKADKKGRFQFRFNVGYGTTLVEVIGPKVGRRDHIGMLKIVRPDPRPPVLTVTAPSSGALATE